MASFEAVAGEYDAARPRHPDAVFDALGPLEGLRVLDVGAGTGILDERFPDGQMSARYETWLWIGAT